MNPQETFIDLLIAAMKDAAIERKLTQLKTTITPEETGKAKHVRLIVIPEEMDYNWPDYAPAGSAGHG